ncbi:MAG: ABC transporter ATP-binding protein, partial [Planctomycetota bacterium]|nr:ABC transporter ATP-binding protein [Planctomycetota bacterium]
PGVRVVKAFGQERREVDRFALSNQAVYESELTMIGLWTMFSPLLALCSRIGFILVWVIGGYWAVHDKLDPGTLMAFVGFMWMFYEPIHMLSHVDRNFNRSATSVQRIFEILDTAPAVFSKAGAHKPDAVGGRIEMRNVTFSYDGVRRVLKGLDLTVEPGRMVGLAGPSGGGKTTTANLICRFYDVIDGRILIDGVDVRDYDVETLRRMIGLVPQEPFLFHGTVAENIAYGHPEASIDQILQAAKAANAHDFIVSFPDGYDTLVGDRGHTLSGGELQRVSIARAILSAPRILILDEATSSVDTETERLIQQALDRLIANRTTIAIAHRLSTLRRADKLVILEKGQKVEEGSHDDLAARPEGVYAKLLRIQQEAASSIAVGR